MLLALFGIKNGGLNLFVNLVVLFLIVVWIALIAWTYFDARRRIKDPFLVTCAAAGIEGAQGRASRAPGAKAPRSPAAPGSPAGPPGVQAGG